MNRLLKLTLFNANLKNKKLYFSKKQDLFKNNYNNQKKNKNNIILKLN